MEIPKACDVCGSATIEGDYGEAWWLCSNKECKKNNPNWNNQYFELYKEKFNKLDDKINKLSKVKIVDYDIAIELHEARWIGEGSGDIKINNSNSLIRFYFDKDKVVYITDDLILLKTLSEVDFDLRLKEMWKLMRERNSIFSFKNS